MVLSTGIPVLRNFRFKAYIWGRSCSGPNLRTSRPQIENSDRFPKRNIVLSSNYNFLLSRYRNGEKKRTKGRTDGRTDGQRDDFKRAHFFKITQQPGGVRAFPFGICFFFEVGLSNQCPQPSFRKKFRTLTGNRTQHL
jgi:hypothetical protein